GFIPTEDTGQIFAFTEAAQDISFDAMVDKQRAAAAIVLKQPYIDQIMSSIGASTINVVPNTGRIFMRLKPREERPPADKIIEDLRPKLAAIPGFRVYPQNLPTIRIGGNLTKALYQYTLQAPDLQELYRWAPIVFERMRTLPGFQDVNTDLQITSPQITVDIDRDKASALRVNAEQIENALYSGYGARQVSTIYTPTNQYWVILELDPRYQRTAQAFQASLKGQGVLLIVTVLVIYLVLGILYESFIHPLTILSGLPSAGVGALLTLLLFRTELNIYGFVGIIMLVGIVKK